MHAFIYAFFVKYSLIKSRFEFKKNSDEILFKKSSYKNFAIQA